MKALSDFLTEHFPNILLILFVASWILLLIIIASDYSSPEMKQKKAFETQICEEYRNRTIDKLPVGCYDYYGVSNDQ
jgi:hypothetical protein